MSVPQVDHLVSVLSLQLQFADATFESILEARRSIYPVLVAQAAQNATDEDIAALRASLARWVDAVHDSEATTQEARRFLELVAAASKNLVLGLLVNALHQMSDAGIEYDLEHRMASLTQSARILEAIERADPDEARALSVRMHDAARSREFGDHWAPPSSCSCPCSKAATRTCFACLSIAPPPQPG